MAKIQEYQVFIASPGDVPEERVAARDVCHKLNKDPLIRKENAAFRAVGWEDAFPEAGRPQEIINRLVAECDLFVCLFHKRLGTPSGKEESGTLEEFLLAYDTWRYLAGMEKAAHHALLQGRADQVSGRVQRSPA